MVFKEVGLFLSFDVNGIFMYEFKGMMFIFGLWNYLFMLMMVLFVVFFVVGNSVIVKLFDFMMNISNIVVKVIWDVFDEKEVVIFEGEVEVVIEFLD